VYRGMLQRYTFDQDGDLDEKYSDALPKHAIDGGYELGP